MDELTYNGKKFSEFDTFFDGSKAFGSPEKDYEIVEIMGRNGGLSIYNNRFKDIILPFPCFVRSAFLTHYRQLVEFLNSQHGYLRLETSKEPNHFRKALFQGIVDPQTTPFNHGGQFTINFLAKPQRFLKSGETPVSSQSQSHSYEGNPVSISNPSGLSNVSSLVVDLEPIQDLNGYDSPWVGGAGKNKANPTLAFVTRSTTLNDVKTGDEVTVDANGKVSYSFTTTGRGVSIYLGYYEAGATFTFQCTIANSGLYRVLRSDSIPSGSDTVVATTVFSRQTDAGSTVQHCTITDAGHYWAAVYKNTQTSPVTVESIMSEIGDTASAYEPYSNICPITGHTEVNVVRTGKNLYDENWGYIGVSRRTWGTGDNNLLALLNSLTAGTYTFIMKATVDTVDASSANRVVGGIFLNSQASINVEATFTTSDFKVGANLTAVKTFTINANQVGKFTNAYYYASVSDASNDKTTITDIGLFYGTQTDYEPYNGTTYPVKFPSINAWDEEWEVGNYDENTGKPITSANSTQRNKNPIHVKPSTKYYFCCETTIATAPSVMVLEYDASGGFLGAFYTYAWTFSFTTKATTKTVNFRVYNTSMSALGDAGNLSFNYPSTYHTYIPYTTPQTVYGGTLDIVSGVLTVDRASVQSSNASEYGMNNGTQYYLKVAYASGIKTPSSPEATVISDKFKPEFSGASGVVFLNTGGYIRFNTADSYDTVADMLGAVGAIQFVYPLATPITYQLTPSQVSLLTGTNIITCDSGDMTITVTEPSLLVNPTLFESKPLLRIYGTGTVNINDQYITISAHSFPYIDIDCELMDAYYGSSNANSYVTFSTNDYITLRSGNNYIAYGNQIEVTPRWYEI